MVSSSSDDLTECNGTLGDEINMTSGRIGDSTASG